jgi:hypothetical protein
VQPADAWIAESYHAAAVAGIDGDAQGPEPRGLRGATGLVSEVTSEDESGSFVYRVVTAVHESRAVQFTVWGRSAAMKLHRVAVEEAIDALHITGLRATVRSGGRYEDHRLGFALDEPGAGWRLAQELPQGLTARGTMVRWTKDGDFVGVVSVCTIGEGQDERWFLDLIDQLWRDQFPKLGVARESEGELSGRPARRLTWNLGLKQRFHAYLLVEGCSIHALLTGGRDEALFERIRASFKLLD